MQGTGKAHNNFQVITPQKTSFLAAVIAHVPLYFNFILFVQTVLLVLLLIDV